MSKNQHAGHGADDAAGRSHQRVHERAARCIQRVFRGWRTRRRVVWAVRAELEAFMAETEAAVEMERLLLALPKPQVHAWRSARDTSLHLPRIQDNVFGWSLSFPPEYFTPPTDAIASSAQDVMPPESYKEELNATEEQKEEDGGVEVCGVLLPDDGGEDSSEPRVDVDGGGHEVDSSSADSLPGRHTNERDDDASSSTTQDVSVEVHRSTDLEHSGSRPSGADLPLTVDRILATHTRAEMELEVAWAKQALRDRVHYLRNRRRMAGAD